MAAENFEMYGFKLKSKIIIVAKLNILSNCTKKAISHNVHINLQKLGT